MRYNSEPPAYDETASIEADLMAVSLGVRCARVTRKSAHRLQPYSDGDSPSCGCSRARVSQLNELASAEEGEEARGVRPELQWLPRGCEAGLCRESRGVPSFDLLALDYHALLAEVDQHLSAHPGACARAARERDVRSHTQRARALQRRTTAQSWSASPAATSLTASTTDASCWSGAAASTRWSPKTHATRTKRH